MYPEVKKTLLALFAAAAIPAMAIDVDTLKVAGPYCMNTPIQTDTADVWAQVATLAPNPSCLRRYRQRKQERAWKPGSLVRTAPFLPCRCGCHVGNRANPAEEATLLLGAPSEYLD